MKKRLMVIVLTLIMVLSLAGCKDQPTPDVDDTTPPVDQEQVDKDQVNTDKEDTDDGAEAPPVSDDDIADSEKPNTNPEKPDEGGVEDHEHKYTDKVVAPTCKAEGYTQHTCSVCGDSYKDTTTQKAAHTFTDKVIEPTCTSNGYTQHTCTVCGHIAKDTTTAKIGHCYIDNVVEPTATAQGYTLHTCYRCNISYKDNYTPATGNSGNSGSSSGGGSGSSSGSSGNTPTPSTPSVPSTPSKPSTPSHQHSYSTSIVPGTCTTKGYTTYTCSCGDSYTADYTGGGGHSYEEVYEEIPVYENVPIMRCGACHANLDDVGGIAHVKEEALAGNPGGGSSYGDTIQVLKGYETQLVGYACSICGAER